MTRVLVDTSVWIDHLHRTDAELSVLLEQNVVVTHPLVIGELALGGIRDRGQVLERLERLPSAPVATHGEVLAAVERRRLFGRGLSLVDAHLLVSALIGGDVRLFTRDRRLRDAASDASVRW